MNTHRPPLRVGFVATVAVALSLALPGLAGAIGASYAIRPAQLTAAPREATPASRGKPACDCSPRSAQSSAGHHRPAAIAPPRNAFAGTLWSRESDRRLRRRASESGRRSDSALRAGGYASPSSSEVRITLVRRTAAVFYEAHAPPASWFPIDRNLS